MIQILDKITANGIAAGEVIERPASVVKELIENSLDAGASIINCDIEQGGIKRILISDNGCGMTPEDAVLAFERHATSKLSKISDLEHLMTMGFRGEALASIAAVSRVNLRTRQIGQEQGFEVIAEGGKLVKSHKTGCPEGTQIEIRDLFYNVPARYKFLKRDQTEQGYIADLVTRLALARSDVSFRLTSNQNTLLHTPGNNNLLSAIYVLYGKETTEAMVEVNYFLEPVKLSGYITTPQVTRGNRSRQIAFVNGRSIASKIISAAITEASKTWFMKGKFPSLVINLEIPLNLVDVNVHPQKTEVRFWDEQIVFRAVYHGIREALETGSTAIKGEITSSHYQSVTPLTADFKETPLNYDFSQRTSQSKETSEETMSELGKRKYDANERISPAEQAQAFMMHQQTDQTVSQASSPMGSQIFSQTESQIINNSVLQHESKELQATDVSQMKHSEFVSEAQPRQSELAYLKDARLIGQVFQTYLLLEYENRFIIIDQHAAHERIIYEQLHYQYLANKNQPFKKQILLQNETLELTAHEMALAEENLEELDRLGFEIDLFGDNTIIIRTVPDTGNKFSSPVTAVKLLIDSLLDQSFFQEDKYDELLYTIACKAAVKAHDNLSYNEMKKLVADLTELVNPYHCPHGRPLIIELSKTDLEKLFKRIV
ncbi:MAG TPA: DNA mismatch repair endonuclease MutL [Clostridiaceae bacterium]|nr:DNA mismatch repair endonuclease MutL [Clostridiaceae bacterium]